MAVGHTEDELANKEGRLVREARSGDLKAFSALVVSYQEKMIHTAYAFLGNMEDAKDAAQEAFVKAYQALGSFHERSRFSTWLHRILINQCKDFLRRKRVTASLRPLAVTGDEEGATAVEEMASLAPDARQEMSDRELESEIYRALDTLPFQQRSVFTLRYLEGLKLEEIAETLGLSVGAVKAHLWQASQKMRILLRTHFPVGGERG